MEVIAKIATSLDGKIALGNGESKWISCEASRQKVHQLRSLSDAIITTSTTAIIDNARLNVRLENAENIIQPKRILIDAFLKTPLEYNIYDMKNSGATIVFCSKFANNLKKLNLNNNEIEYYEIDCKEGMLNLVEVFQKLKQMGFKSIMIEAGGKFLRSLINLGLVDKFIWFRAPIIIGNDGIPAFGEWGFQTLDKAIKFKLEKIEIIGDDIMETYTVLGK